MESQGTVRYILSVKKVTIMSLWRYDYIVTKYQRILRELLIQKFILQNKIYLKRPRHAFHVIHISVRSNLCSTQKTISIFPIFLTTFLALRGFFLVNIDFDVITFSLQRL